MDNALYDMYNLYLNNIRNTWVKLTDYPFYGVSYYRDTYGNNFRGEASFRRAIIPPVAEYPSRPPQCTPES